MHQKIIGAFDDRCIEYKLSWSENISIQQYFQKIRSYLGHMIDKLKKAGELKIQFTMNVNNVSSKCNDDKQYILKVII